MFANHIFNHFFECIDIARIQCSIKRAQYQYSFDLVAIHSLVVRCIDQSAQFYLPLTKHFLSK